MPDNLPVENNMNIDAVETIINKLLAKDDIPDDKKIEVSIGFVVVPKIDISISNK
jgi:hypothetical protein